MCFRMENTAHVGNTSGARWRTITNYTVSPVSIVQHTISFCHMKIVTTTNHLQKITETPVLPSILYSIEIHQRHITEKDVYSVDNALRRYRKCCPDTSFFRAISQKDSKSAKRKTIKTGKRGRPRTKVLGRKKPLHLHIGVLGNSAHKYATLVQKAIKKRLQ